jgi:hypothetical protein
MKKMPLVSALGNLNKRLELCENSLELLQKQIDLLFKLFGQIFAILGVSLGGEKTWLKRKKKESPFFQDRL